jgi:hypothetical protein
MHADFPQSLEGRSAMPWGEEYPWLTSLEPWGQSMTPTSRKNLLCMLSGENLSERTAATITLWSK